MIVYFSGCQNLVWLGVQWLFWDFSRNESVSVSNKNNLRVAVVCCSFLFLLICGVDSDLDLQCIAFFGGWGGGGKACFSINICFGCTKVMVKRTWHLVCLCLFCRTICTQHCAVNWHPKVERSQPCRPGSVSQAQNHWSLFSDLGYRVNQNTMHNAGGLKDSLISEKTHKVGCHKRTSRYIYPIQVWVCKMSSVASCFPCSGVDKLLNLVHSSLFRLCRWSVTQESTELRFTHSAGIEKWG